MSKFVQRKDIPTALWDDVVSQSEDGWVFALSGWLDLILAVEEWRLEDFSFGLEVNGQITAVVPLQFSAPRRMLGMSGWGGCGPILRDVADSAARASILSAIHERCAEIAFSCGAAGIEFSQTAVTAACMNNEGGVNHAVFYGFEDRSGLTQVVDLRRDVQALWGDLSKNARNIIRKSEKEGVSAELVDWPDHLENYYRLHCETYGRTGVEPHPHAYFAGIAERMAQRGNAVLLAALGGDGRVVAYHNDAWFGPGALYHTGCSSDDAQQTGANYLLLWKAMIMAKEAGKAFYEVGNIFPNTADRKQHGLTVFKTRFGGRPYRALRSFKEFSTSGGSIDDASIRGNGNTPASVAGNLRRIVKMFSGR